jgi:hypothetical protein
MTQAAWNQNASWRSNGADQAMTLDGRLCSVEELSPVYP